MFACLVIALSCYVVVRCLALIAGLFLSCAKCGLIGWRVSACCVFMYCILELVCFGFGFVCAMDLVCLCGLIAVFCWVLIRWLGLVCVRMFCWAYMLLWWAFCCDLVFTCLG